ncbi:SMC-Scp complex subunit ScpB [Rubrobacter tropicus]|uniref:SMC-Scp complex subunit ScpB n=1 Tax=Rubrobacter tropicus TaxID=2653851 RepID=A0A6G8Q969_9ACTN|nr:SMC-Scp complex subunit ScpB [Rubrobacter tropicus]QIN83016.1 SMC-Scp complex subunit ScpB [Rubrobacter tropicus]
MTENVPAPEHLIESVLLVSARPVGPDDLSSATDLTPGEVEAALATLSERYSPENSGVVLRAVAGGYLFSTNPACSAAVERFREEARPTPLSGAAHEVLACALYLGPLTRGAISRVRGVNSDAVVRNLLERDLLAEVGADREAPGAPALLAVTDEFLAATDAASRDDFPPLDSLVSQEELDRVRERLTSREEIPAQAGPEAT